MSELFLHGNQVTSVFHLLGTKENSMTYSLAWVLSRSPHFLREYIGQIFPEVKDKVNPKNVVIHLQNYDESDAGFTDIEIRQENLFEIIIEAKKGWNLPGEDQLRKYSRRLMKSNAVHKTIVVLAEANKEYAMNGLDSQWTRPIQMTYVSWKDFFNLIDLSYTKENHANKKLLHELKTYLQGVVSMQNKDSNWVYVVSLSKDIPEGWNISWKDIVEKKSKYFHPADGSGGFPKEPPNYIAFRYDGQLQSIHHIESYKLITRPHEEIEEIPPFEWESPHFIYDLGPKIVPQKTVKNGPGIRFAARTWCMLDTLLTCDTITEARKVSVGRMEN